MESNGQGKRVGDEVQNISGRAKVKGVDDNDLCHLCLNSRVRKFTASIFIGLLNVLVCPSRERYMESLMRVFGNGHLTNKGISIFRKSFNPFFRDILL